MGAQQFQGFIETLFHPGLDSFRDQLSHNPDPKTSKVGGFHPRLRGCRHGSPGGLNTGRIMGIMATNNIVNQGRISDSSSHWSDLIKR
jgi:hypothetical protein